MLSGPADRFSYARIALAVFGVGVVLFGAADLVSRSAHALLGPNADTSAFGPAIVALQGGASAASFATSAPPITPARLTIPAIGVDAAIESVGKKADGTMATPSSFTRVAWYELGSKPGEPGSAVIAGHVNNALTTPGVFEHLDELHLGDVVVVTDANGKSLRFAVRDIEDYPSDSAPTNVIFSSTSPSQVVLITCIGDWDPKARSYDHRLVVYAGLLAS